jgi:hypothetical protein
VLIVEGIKKKGDNLQYAECPLCKTSVEVNESQFGALTSCSSCGGVYFLGWDGQPEEQVAEPIIEAVKFEATSEEAYQPDPIDYNFESTASELDNEPLVVEQVYETNEPTPLVVFSESDRDSSPESEASYDIDQPIDSYHEASYADSEGLNLNTEKENFNDVVEFGNSNLENVLSYQLKIEGIDLPSTRRDVEDVLRESRFQLDADSLLSNLQDGTLVIENLSPVKASLLVHRLRFFQVNLSWRQDANS